MVCGRISNIYDEPRLLTLHNKFSSDEPQNFAQDSCKKSSHRKVNKIVNVTELYIICPYMDGKIESFERIWSILDKVYLQCRSMAIMKFGHSTGGVGCQYLPIKHWTCHAFISNILCVYKYILFLFTDGTVLRSLLNRGGTVLNRRRPPTLNSWRLRMMIKCIVIQINSACPDFCLSFSYVFRNATIMCNVLIIRNTDWKYHN